MKPAFSVIFLTTLIGAGQGLFVAFFSLEIFSLLGIITAAQDTPQATPSHAIIISLISLTLLFAGLIASFFHLGHPERAWRAATMWRTSWLSREVIALPITMAAIFAYGSVFYLQQDTVLIALESGFLIKLSFAIGLFALLAIFILYFCTAMIYACIKFIGAWHHPLTVFNFLFMGLASGFTLATLISSIIADGNFNYFSNAAILFCLLALATRYSALRRNRNLVSPSTLQSAIGIKDVKIRQIAQGAMGGSFNTRAFIHSYGAVVVKTARHFFFIAAFLLPIALLLLNTNASIAIAALALLSQYCGLLVERWYFFIEAKHPQNLYYQMIS